MWTHKIFSLSKQVHFTTMWLNSELNYLDCRPTHGMGSQGSPQLLNAVSPPPSIHSDFPVSKISLYGINSTDFLNWQNLIIIFFIYSSPTIQLGFSGGQISSNARKSLCSLCFPIHIHIHSRGPFQFSLCFWSSVLLFKSMRAGILFVFLLFNVFISRWIEIKLPK